MHIVLAAADSRDELRQELAAAFPGSVREQQAGLFACDPGPGSAVAIPRLVFARQVLPLAREVGAPSIRAWATLLCDAVMDGIPEHAPWSLQVYPLRLTAAAPRMGARAWHSRGRAGHAPLPPAERRTEGVGPERCRLIRETLVELLQKRRRHVLRALRPEGEPFAGDDSLVQLVLVTNEAGFLSVAPAPLPFEARHTVSCFTGGEVAIARDVQAPSRAFAKLVEAEARLGRRIAPGERCVDLGASPGSWTYVAVTRGARVTAVDRSELRPDLMQSRQVRFHRGDAFRFTPDAPVDWLLCDIVASAERSAELLAKWLRNRWCRHFVVTLKTGDAGADAPVARLLRELPERTSALWLMRLCANKKEICAFGSAAEPTAAVPEGAT